MDNRPIIGITTQTLDAIPDQLPRCWVMSQRYVQMLVTVGAVPWVIPLLEGDEATLRGIYERIDGLFLPGGVDVDPSAYGEARGPHCQRTDPARGIAPRLVGPLRHPGREKTRAHARPGRSHGESDPG